MALDHPGPALAPGKEPELALHLREVVKPFFIERAVFERGADRAAGFVFVPAVAEATFAGQRLNVSERTIDFAFVAPELELAAAAPVGQCAQAGSGPLAADR